MLLALTWGRAASGAQSRGDGPLLPNSPLAGTARRKRCVPRARLLIYAQAFWLVVQSRGIAATTSSMTNAPAGNLATTHAVQAGKGVTSRLGNQAA
jgi:hypothetical protein